MWYTIGNKGRTMPHIRLMHSVALIRCRCRLHRCKKQAGLSNPPLLLCPSAGLTHLHKQCGLVSSGCGSNHCTWTESVLQGLLQGSVKRRVTALTGADGMTALPSDCWGYSCVRSGFKITGADIGIYRYSIVKIKIYCI